MQENDLPFLKALEKLCRAERYGKFKATASLRFHAGV